MELKFPIKIKNEKGEEKVLQYLSAGRLKVKHFKLLPKTLMERLSEEGKDFTQLSAAEMLPLFEDMIPFIAGICGITKEEADEIDFDDIENVIKLLEEVFPKEKK